MNTILALLRRKGTPSGRQTAIDEAVRTLAASELPQSTACIPGHVAIGGFELNDADLAMLDLSRVGMIDAVLRNVKCNGTTFGNAHNCLFEALHGSRATFARLSDCTFVDAYLPDATIGPLTAGCDFTGAMLRGMQYRQMASRPHPRPGHNATFRSADLRDCDAAGCDLAQCCFERASLEGARLSGAALIGCDFRQANLRGSQLVQSDVTGAVMEGASVAHAAVSPRCAAHMIRELATGAGQMTIIELPRRDLFAPLSCALGEQPEYHIAWDMKNPTNGKSERISVFTEERSRPLGSALACKGRGHFRSFAVEGPRDVESLLVDIAGDYVGWKADHDSLSVSGFGNDGRQAIMELCHKAIEDLRATHRPGEQGP